MGYGTPDESTGLNPIVEINLRANQNDGFYFQTNPEEQYIGLYHRHEDGTLMIGGGVRLSSTHAVNELLELGKELKIPMFPTWNALDIVCSDYEYYGGRIGTYGGAGRNFGIQNSDLLLAIGSRISGRITGGNIHTFAREAKKYMVDVDKAGLQPKLQQVPFDVNIYSDARLFIEILRDE